MKVCAHANYGPHQMGHSRCATVREAVSTFANALKDMGITQGDGEHYTLDLYPQCNECDDAMCFHDYPMSRFELSKRGSIVKVTV